MDNQNTLTRVAEAIKERFGTKQTDALSMRIAGGKFCLSDDVSADLAKAALNAMPQGAVELVTLVKCVNCDKVVTEAESCGCGEPSYIDHAAPIAPIVGDTSDMLEVLRILDEMEYGQTNQQNVDILDAIKVKYVKS